MRDRLTPRQRQVLDFIADTIRSRGYPPTIREIGERFGISSTNGVRAILSVLAKKGYIERKPFVSRGIELKAYPIPSDGVTWVPIVGRIAAGQPVLAAENIEGTLALDRSWAGSGELFALRVKGDSMQGAGIFDGDYVIVRQQPTAENGEIVAAIVGEEATVKRLFREGNLIRLMPENSAMEPIVIRKREEEVRIAGKVVGVLRKI